jgi:hypothetical protein
VSSGDKVWIIEDSVVGEVLNYGAVMSLIRWHKDGIVYEEYLENFEFLEYERVDLDNEEV